MYFASSFDGLIRTARWKWSSVCLIRLEPLTGSAIASSNVRRPWSIASSDFRAAGRLERSALSRAACASARNAGREKSYGFAARRLSTANFRSARR